MDFFNNCDLEIPLLNKLKRIEKVILSGDLRKICKSVLIEFDFLASIIFEDKPSLMKANIKIVQRKDEIFKSYIRPLFTMPDEIDINTNALYSYMEKNSYVVKSSTNNIQNEIKVKNIQDLVIYNNVDMIESMFKKGNIFSNENEVEICKNYYFEALTKIIEPDIDRYFIKVRQSKFYNNDINDSELFNSDELTYNNTILKKLFQNKNYSEIKELLNLKSLTEDHEEISSIESIKDQEKDPNMIEVRNSFNQVLDKTKIELEDPLSFIDFSQISSMFEEYTSNEESDTTDFLSNPEDTLEEESEDTLEEISESMLEFIQNQERQKDLFKNKENILIEEEIFEQEPAEEKCAEPEISVLSKAYKELTLPDGTIFPVQLLEYDTICYIVLSRLHNMNSFIIKILNLYFDWFKTKLYSIENYYREIINELNFINYVGYINILTRKYSKDLSFFRFVIVNTNPKLHSFMINTLLSYPNFNSSFLKGIVRHKDPFMVHTQMVQDYQDSIQFYYFKNISIFNLRAYLNLIYFNILKKMSSNDENSKMKIEIKKMINKEILRLNSKFKSAILKINLNTELFELEELTSNNISNIHKLNKLINYKLFISKYIKS